MPILLGISYTVYVYIFKSMIIIVHFSKKEVKCDQKGCCSKIYTTKTDATIENCNGKEINLCRYKCRCDNRFKHTEEEISVYRQITHYWDGGVDYYTGNELIKHRQMVNLREKYKLLEKSNIKAGLVQSGNVGAATQASQKCSCKRCRGNSSNNSMKSY